MWGVNDDIAERLDYATRPVARPLGWRWAVPLGMNCVSAGIGTLLALWVWPAAAYRLDHAVLTLVVPPFGLVVLLQILLLAFSLAITRDTRQPTWNPIVRRAVLWSAPVGLFLPLLGLVLGAGLG